MKLDTADLITAADAAKLLSVRPNVFSNWQRRYAFPAPVFTGSNGKIKLWSRTAIVDWHLKRMSPELREAIRHG